MADERPFCEALVDVGELVTRRVTPGPDPGPLISLGDAVDFLRDKADEWRCGANSVKGHHLPLKHVYRWLGELKERHGNTSTPADEAPMSDPIENPAWAPCPKCKRSKSADDFYRDRTREPRCKICCRERTKESGKRANSFTVAEVRAMDHVLKAVLQRRPVPELVLRGKELANVARKFQVMKGGGEQ